MTEPFHEIFRKGEKRPSKEPAGGLSSGSKDAKIRVDTVADERAFLALRPVWDQLVQEAKIDHPFLSHDWVRVWWRCFGAGHKLQILVVKAGDRPIAIAPLMVSVDRMYGFRMRKIGFIANVHTPRFDIIVADRPKDAYRAIWERLKEQADAWDAVELTQVPSDSQTLKEVPILASRDNFLTGIWHSEDCPYLDFDQGWNALLRRLSHNHRAQMGKRLRRLRRDGQVRLEVLSNHDDLQRQVTQGFEIEAAAWKAKSGTAILCRPDLVCFYREIAEEAARSGLLRLVFLSVGGKRIAFAYALFYKNKIYVLKSGYDPDYSAYSPYLLLCHLLFQECCERGVAEYEFLGASDPWKLRWADKTRSHYWLYVMPRQLRTSLIHAVKFGALPTLRRGRLYSLLRYGRLHVGLVFLSLLPIAAA
ncbi:MAG TPA: GNAT family N-acetyltransferase [Candidatus Binatia bacterium]|nr:GNAT family N-acetyltransferase [Candidatus Binatia bacterium]